METPPVIPPPPPPPPPEMPVAALSEPSRWPRRVFFLALLASVACFTTVLSALWPRAKEESREPSILVAQRFVNGLCAGRRPLQGSGSETSGLAVAYSMLAPSVKDGLGFESFEQQFLMLEDDVGPILATQRTDTRGASFFGGGLFRFELRCGHPRAKAADLASFTLTVELARIDDELRVLQYELIQSGER